MKDFKTEVLNEHFIRIIDISGVCCYLVIGEKRAVLLDTCCGYGDLRAFVETLTDKPVFVILTHGHHDHMGASSLFDEVYMNPDDNEVFCSFGSTKRRLHDIREMTGVSTITEADLIPVRTAEIMPIRDGDQFDLGGLTVQMILVKGHTPGMMCPLLVEDRKIIFGDACGVGVLLFDEFSSTVSEYRESLRRLKQFEDNYDEVYRNHGTFVSGKELLDHVIECCDLILAGEDDRMPVVVHGFDLFAAKQTDGHGRVDGKEGNIMYALDKAR